MTHRYSGWLVLPLVCSKTQEQNFCYGDSFRQTILQNRNIKPDLRTSCRFNHSCSLNPNGSSSECLPQDLLHGNCEVGEMKVTHLAVTQGFGSTVEEALWWMSRTWASHLQCNVLEMCKSDDKRNKSDWGLGGLGEFRRRRVATRLLRTICCLICYFNACLVPCLYGLMRTSVLTAVPRPDDTHWAAARARFSCVSACDPLWLYPPGSRRRARFNTFPRRYLTPTSCGPIRHKNMSADRHSASLMAQCDSNVTRSGLIFMADHCNTCRPPGGADSPPVRPIKSNFRDTR